MRTVTQVLAIGLIFALSGNARAHNPAELVYHQHSPHPERVHIVSIEPVRQRSAQHHQRSNATWQCRAQPHQAKRIIKRRVLIGPQGQRHDSPTREQHASRHRPQHCRKVYHQPPPRRSATPHYVVRFVYAGKSGVFRTQRTPSYRAGQWVSVHRTPLRPRR